MGIRQLQSFMQRNVHHGFVDCSIKVECEKYFRKHKERPIIVVDLMGLVNIVLKDASETLCGGRNNMYELYYDEMLRNLASCADLVFFLDGPVVSQKFDTWVQRQNSRYENGIKIMDLVYVGIPVRDIVARLPPPSITFHLSVLKHVAKKYGKIITTVTKECDCEIARYATLEPRAIAVLADDSDFLIYPSRNWKYLSIKEMDHTTLMTKEYSKSALKKCLQLNNFQLLIFATLAGNDVIKFEEVERFHMSLVGTTNFYVSRFFAIAKFIREKLPTDFQRLMQAIAHAIFQSTSTRSLNRVAESFDNFSIDFTVQEPTDALLKLCRDNHFDFTYSILQKMSKNFTLSFYDLRKYPEPRIHDIQMMAFRKQAGIVLMHNRSENIEIGAKLSHQDSYRKHKVQPIYPEQQLPPLIELLSRQEFPAHDPLRFALLKWTIGDNDKLRNFNLERIPLNILLDILVLTFMVDNNLLTPFEADLILLSIKHVNIHIVPDDLKVPACLDARAFHISFLFAKLHSIVHRSLEVTGLKMLKKVFNFDGVLFHNLFLKFQTSPCNIELLISDLAEYCLYKS